MQKFDTGARNAIGTEALDIYISNAITKGNDIERHIDIIEDIIIKWSRRTFGRYKITKNNKKENSVPRRNTHLTVMRKEVNAKRRLYQRTVNDIVLRERRKEK